MNWERRRRISRPLVLTWCILPFVPCQPDHKEPADIVAQTALEAALTSEQQDDILNHLCSNVLCKKRRMKKHTMFLLGLGKVDIDQTEDPVDKLGAFMSQHRKLGRIKPYHQWRAQKSLCDSIVCPAKTLSTLDLTWAGKQVQLPITNLEPPKKIASQFCKASGCQADHERQIATAIRQELKQVHNQKQAALARRAAVDKQRYELNVTGVGTLTLQPIDEPVDAVHAFCQKHGLAAKAEQELLQHLCQQPQITCTRTQPRKTLFSVSLNWDGSQHELEVGDIDDPRALAGKFCSLYGCTAHVESIRAAIDQRLVSFKQQQHQQRQQGMALAAAPGGGAVLSA